MKTGIFSLVLVAASVAFALAGGTLLGGVHPPLAALSLLLGCAAGGVAFFRTPKEKLPPMAGMDWIVAGVFLFAAARSFLWLLYESGAEMRIGSPYNLGDLALHVQIIQYLASGVPLWPANPIFLEGVMRYPAGINLWNALLLEAGAPLAKGLVWTGLAGSVLSLFWLRKWGGSFAVAVLLFSGGFAGFFFFSPAWASIAEGIEWKNLFLTSFVTQRGYLWALPAGLALLCCWRARINGKPAPFPFWVELLLYAILPLFHLHSFLFLSALLVAGILTAPREGKLAFLRLGIAAFLPASVLVWTVTGGFAVSGGFQWFPGWLSVDKGLSFWWINFGISLPLFAVLTAVVFWKKQRDAMAFVGTSLLVLIACFLFRFAPWAWDNVKLMIWVWLATAPFLWETLLRPLPLAGRVPLLAALFFSGALTLADGLSSRHLYGWVNRKEYSAAADLLKGLNPAETRLALAPCVPHPVALQGFPVAVGYPGHLWSHGYNYRATEMALEVFFSSGTESELLSPITHAVIGPQERAKFGPGLWMPPPSGWHLVKQSGGMSLYGRKSAGLPTGLPDEDPD